MATSAAGFRWSSPNVVMAIAIAAALVVLSACAALIYYAEGAVDRTMRDREVQLMDSALNHRLSEMLEDVTPSSVWSDAYDKAVRSYDPKFLHSNYGDNYQRFRKHDITVVFDAADRPVYAGKDLTALPPERLADFIERVRPVLAKMRKMETQRLAEDPGALGLKRRVGASTGLRVGDEVYLLGATTIVPDLDYRRPLIPGPAPVVVSAMKVDGDVLAVLDRESGLKGAKLLLYGPFDAYSTQIMDVDGNVVAGLISTPPRLVHGVFYEARWRIAGLGVLVVTVVALLIYSLQRLARGVEQARDRAEAGDFAKSEFIANMSHEIRTPLNGVLGMAQVMEAGELSADQRARLKVIRESGATLLDLLNDVLDLSKIEAGKLEIVPSPFVLEDLVQRVGATFQGVAAAKDLDLRVAVACEARGVWLGDALRLRQVLSNLVSNAVKFTDAGSVTLSVAASDAGLRFDVADTGIGLDEARAHQLFDKFAQADASVTRRYGGTGLGLSIVEALLTMMGGRVSVESRPGQGSCFTVLLPLTRVSGEAAVAAPDSAPVQASVRTLRVLAAEDNPTNQYVLRALMEPLGAELTLVGTGREAVEAFAADAFDVVLMDIQMPEMSGVDATRAIRAMETADGRARTPILALTANVMNHQLEGYLAAGMDGHISKPLDIAALFAAIDGVLVEQAAREAAA